VHFAEVSELFNLASEVAPHKWYQQEFNEKRKRRVFDL